MEAQCTTYMDDISILDRVLSSKQSESIEKFNPNETLAALFRHLSTKEEDVLRRRFGLGGQQEATLEEIGAQYAVTRERIRQIENGAIQKLRSLKEFGALTSATEELIRQVLETHGGAMTEENLLHELFRVSGVSDGNHRALQFILTELMPDTFDMIGEEEGLRKGWKLKAASLSIIHDTIAHIRDMIQAHGKPMTLDVIYDIAKQHQYFQEHHDRITDEALVSYMELSPEISKNPFHEYGLTAWGSIVPKRMNDKIYLVLKKHGSPLHFTEITKLINETGFDRRKAYPPTVHNELILNAQYVLVGRGIYALKEWGYKSGVVADVIEEMLRQSSEPLSRDEIVRRVLEQRVVKKNTIHLALADKARFTRTDDGKYTLAVST